MARVPAAPSLTEEGGLRWDLTQAPPAPVYVRVHAAMEGIVGRPCVWLHRGAAAWETGWRVTCLPFELEGQGAVEIVPEAEWWAAAYAGREPTVGLKTIHIEQVWLTT